MKLAILSWGATRACACGFALLFIAATAQSADVGEDPVGAQDREIALLDKAREEGKVRVIATFADTAESEELVATMGTAAALASVQEGVLDRLTHAADVDLDSVKRFGLVPGMAVAVDAVTLQLLLDDPEVSAVQEDVPQPPTLYQSIPLIDADLGWGMGYTGAGQTVAILDTGVNKNHPFFPGKVVSEACYSTNANFGSGYTATSLCPGLASSSTAPNSGLDCPAPAIRGCGHGTHVAGIAAGTNGASSGGTMHGVARDAKVIAIKVFSRLNAAYCQAIGYSNNDCALSYTSDQILGLEPEVSPILNERKQTDIDCF